MDARLPFWWRTTTTPPVVTSTITMTEIFVEATDFPLHDHIRHALQQYADRFPCPSTATLSTLLAQVLALYAMWYIWRLLHPPHGRSVDEKGDEIITREAWLAPWRTIDWTVLYGLLALSYSRHWSTTPFRQQFSASIHDRWHNRRPENYLSRLLVKGIVPLHFQRGGASTTQDRTWKLLSGFPFIQIPSYTQAKNRAYFEFFVPHPRRESARRFLQALVDNEEGYGVAVRLVEPQWDGKMKHTDMNVLIYEDYNFPMSVGVRAPFKIFLPILRARVLKGSLGRRARHLRPFVESDDEKSVPLMQNAKQAMVRVEATSFEDTDLDGWVLSVARQWMLGTPWPRDVVEAAARVELRRQKLPIQGI